ncbi:MAG: hypothetical protein J6T72_01870, partial [Alphaproteobacteria bacterium]|nr:hypothetical protein [Alphaproteobacteria bacterium]
MKLRKFFLFSVAVIFPAVANSSDDSILLEQALSSFSTYKGISVTENGENFTINFPKTDTLKQSTDEEGKIINISGTIPSYEATATKSGDFQGKDSYKINTTATEALLSYLYQKFKITDTNVTKFSSELYFVPALRFMKYIDAKANDIIFSSVDQKTGLKSEIGAIKQANFKSIINTKEDNISYQAIVDIRDITSKILFVDIMIPEFISKISATYENTPDIDYSKFPADVASMQQSKSVIEIKNAEFSILGINANASLGMSNRIETSKDKMRLQIDGKFIAKDIKVGQSIGNIPQDITVKYELGNIDNAQVLELQQLQKKLEKAQSNSQEEQNLKQSCTAAAEKAIKDIKLKILADVKYANAFVKMDGYYEQKGDFIVGNSDITINNFDNLYPDMTEQCEKDKQTNSNAIPASCIQNMTSMKYRKYIKLEKRTTDTQGNTIDTVKIIA